MFVQVAWSGDGLPRFERAVAAMASGKLAQKLDRAVERTGAAAYQTVTTTLAEQVGLPTADTVGLGNLAGRLLRRGGAYEIRARGRHLPLKRWAPRQVAGGVVAAPWGRMTLFDGAFMGPRPGVIASRLGGHAWTRAAGASRHPIRKLWGPNIAGEMVKGGTPAAFQAVVARELPAEIRRAALSLPGAVF